jgi:hypothetical protein
MSSLGTILSKVKGPALDLLKQVGQEAGKELLSHGKSFVERKMRGGEASGGAMSGGRSRGLDARLM